MPLLTDKTASMAQNSLGEHVIKITFPYDLTMLNNIRSLSGRKFHGEEKCWSAPVQIETLQSLLSWNFKLDSTLLSYIQKVQLKEVQITKQGIPGLKGALFPFQTMGVAFIESHKGRVLIADEMGLGKTVQALAWLQLHKELRPAIIVVPASLKYNWEREAETWLDNPKVEILSGTTTWKTTGNIIIINYDILPAWCVSLQKRMPKVLITDECHYYKSNKAQRTKAVKKLGKGTPYIIALSGTPIINRPIEMYNALQLINPGLFPNYFTFAKRYCDAKQTVFGWDVKGSSNAQELHQILTTSIMLRRLKKEVLPDLPAKLRSFVPIELENAKDYKFAEANFIEFVRREKGNVAASKAANIEALASIEGLKQLAVKGKLKQTIDWIENFLDIGEKLVVFATHKFVIDALMNKFGNIAVKIDGSVNTTIRQKAVDLFQTNDDVRLFIGNIQAAGVGLTLTAASNVAFIELPWTPGALSQAEDRCHRIGQKDSVNIHFLLAKDTIEEKIAQILDKKRVVLDAVLDGEETETQSLLMQLIQGYLHK